MIVDANNYVHQKAEGNFRIVSLVPSITELLFDLGLKDSIVGRTPFCIHPEAEVRNVKKIGGTKTLDVEKIMAVKPTHVVLNIDE
ncbi:MAG: helical backbone metal receptor, partial [Pseudomonadota bacterium]|nr:helical backbone metal receptor [Pseudomonadota bacterium]